MCHTPGVPWMERQEYMKVPLQVGSESGPLEWQSSLIYTLRLVDWEHVGCSWITHKLNKASIHFWPLILGPNINYSALGEHTPSITVTMLLFMLYLTGVPFLPPLLWIYFWKCYPFLRAQFICHLLQEVFHGHLSSKWFCLCWVHVTVSTCMMIPTTSHFMMGLFMRVSGHSDSRWPNPMG